MSSLLVPMHDILFRKRPSMSEVRQGCGTELQQLREFTHRARLGCIDFSVEAFWLTCVGRFHLRAQAMTPRERGLSNRSAEANDRADLLYGEY
jgi:hypothetical protein